MPVERQLVPEMKTGAPQRKFGRQYGSFSGCLFSFAEENAAPDMGQRADTYPIQERILALGEYSLAFPPNRINEGPHGHSLEIHSKNNLLRSDLSSNEDEVLILS